VQDGSLGFRKQMFLSQPHHPHVRCISIAFVGNLDDCKEAALQLYITAGNSCWVEQKANRRPDGTRLRVGKERPTPSKNQTRKGGAPGKNKSTSSQLVKAAPPAFRIVHTQNRLILLRVVQPTNLTEISQLKLNSSGLQGRLPR
jgi:hypothetical protein